MGGYAFDLSKSPAFIPGSPKRITITPAGVSFLAMRAPEILPELSRAQIDDKSKGSGIAKTIVCVQALWFCLQCVAHAAGPLPFSLLEVIPFSHAILTLVTYCFWWRKPLNISEPTLLRGDSAMSLCAYMWMASKMQSGHKHEFEGLNILNRRKSDSDIW